MKSYQIKVSGIVQGVGFRPFIYHFFNSQNINGTVYNTTNGVRIKITTDKNIEVLTKNLLKTQPKQSKITSITTKIIPLIEFNTFTIQKSANSKKTKLAITPDFAICEDCASEITQKENRRYHYPFTTCTNCGPRVSIIHNIPYDREETTMNTFSMCKECLEEYHSPENRRFHSQTNSCPKCKVDLFLVEKEKTTSNFSNLNHIIQQWQKGKIVTIKNTGGYLLTCDANNPETIKRLRKLKGRPSKPFALMYHDIYELAEDVEMGIGEKITLEEPAAPIVILALKNEHDRLTPIATNDIAPDINYIGVMMPSTPLFKLLLDKFKKPIIATSANITSAPIIFKDTYTELEKLSDIIVSNNRSIVIPQDDSVVKYSSINFYRTIIRRSRGLSPAYLNSKLKIPKSEDVLAMGALLKSTFTILSNQNIHISQYIGNTIDFETQNNYKHCLQHFTKILNPRIKTLLIDKHPSYFTSEYGKEIAKEKNIAITEIQHHKAHFYAVLGENNLLETNEKILGVIWDGTGYGDDGNIWGGEFFIYHKGTITRKSYLPEYPYFLGDKMAKEPRLSAFAICSTLKSNKIISTKFTKQENTIYTQLIKDTTLKSTSIGRLFDAVASLVLGIDFQTYEGEAAMKLENAAYKYFRKNNFTLYYSYLVDNKIPDNFTTFIVENIIRDIEKGYDPCFISAKFHISVAHYVKLTAEKLAITNIAFSGGVFQNQWLIELLLAFMKKDFTLYFHKELSPNDENISFGQLMYYFYNKD